MNPRVDFDITVLLAETVSPALRSVFKLGEVESVTVAWEEPVVLPDGTPSTPTELNVHLVCKGEQHTSQLWSVGIESYDCEQLTEHLVTEFSDFVAESRFGWGEQR